MKSCYRLDFHSLQICDYFIQLLQIGLAPQKITALARTLVNDDFGSLVVVDQTVLTIGYAKGIGNREEGEMRDAGIQQVFTEGEIFVTDTQLGKQRGGNILL